MTSPSVTPNQGFVISNSLYNRGKWVTMVFLPAFSTFYFALNGIWGLPYTTQVVGTIAALTTFFGVLLGISTKAYNGSDAQYDGSMDVVVNPDTGGKTFSLNLNGDPENLELLPKVTFKVNPPPSI